MNKASKRILAILLAILITLSVGMAAGAAEILEFPDYPEVIEIIAIPEIPEADEHPEIPDASALTAFPFVSAALFPAGTMSGIVAQSMSPEEELFLARIVEVLNALEPATNRIYKRIDKLSGQQIAAMDKKVEEKTRIVALEFQVACDKNDYDAALKKFKKFLSILLEVYSYELTTYVKAPVWWAVGTSPTWMFLTKYLPSLALRFALFLIVTDSPLSGPYK